MEEFLKNENAKNVFDNLKKEKEAFLGSLKEKCEKENSDNKKGSKVASYERACNLLNQWESSTEKEILNIKNMQLEKQRNRAVESIKNNFTTMKEQAEKDFNLIS